MTSEEVVIGKKDFVPLREGYMPMVAIYMNDNEEVIIVPSQTIKQNFEKEEADKAIEQLIKAVADNYNQEMGE